MDRIIILAAGSSVKKFNVDSLYDKGYVVGIKDAPLYTKCHHIFNQDRLWFEDRYPRISKLGIPGTFSRNCTKSGRFTDIPNNWDFFEYDRDCHYMSNEEGMLHGPNSGFCAINWAYKQRPKEVFLFGFDRGKNKAGDCYWYPFYEYHPTKDISDGKYDRWTRIYAQTTIQFAAINTKVYNVNPENTIEDFEHKTFKEFEKM